mgnify:CR=1 FL=1
MKTHGTAVWRGGSTDGEGTITGKSGAIAKVAFGSPIPHQFEKKGETNPEELLAGAHVTCYTLTLAHLLQKAGLKPERLEATAEITLEKGSTGLTMPSSHLTLKAKIPGADRAKFEELAEKARTGCFIGQHLKLAITLDAALEN